MHRLSRLSSDQIDMDRTLHFSLPVLRQGPILPLKPLDGIVNPVAVSDKGAWPWELLDDCRRIFGVEVQPVLVDRDDILIALNTVFDMAQTSAEQMLEDMHEAADL
jgi:hypothetical protein